MAPTTAYSIVLHTALADEAGTKQYRLPKTPVPGVCAKHGLPATKTVAVLVRPKREIGPGIKHDIRRYLLGGFWELIANSATQLRDGPAVQTEWPLCSRCETKRRWCLRSAAILAAGGVVLVLVAIGLGAADLRGPLTTTAFLAGLIAQPFALLLLHTTGPGKLLHATATPDGSAVIVTDPHPNFAAAVRASQG
ncbi:hypothetical protein M2284_004794 [Rhodococcus sp. LBL1]|nr:hypothetical protein [Rhodococcus sp. LBL1]MDH6686114.1 hypothetical protein [Rhodococcus sp. LBL2]